MPTITYGWQDGDAARTLTLVRVEGTKRQPYSFGEGDQIRQLDVQSFFIATTPMTQSFWAHVMGEAHQCARMGPMLPLENLSWDEIMRPGGFFDRLQRSDAGKHILRQASLNPGVFRLPSEAEWEYAARGGPHWRDDFRFSGSNDIGAVAWYDRRDGDYTQEVARKAPNQLGLYDMSGNVWEWCRDTFIQDVAAIPADGSPNLRDGPDRVLRGGCFHNWAIHCTVSKRYAIGRQDHDGCIGFRVVLAGP
jgi:formylglycine-generating enzyme required for sulfatase activity